ncbi:hypothetical protein AVP42_01039 [Agromyces sp. NDB4Y10]|nr:hypothetical protein AVP42_01039 [Agromyces sp. NDB4Y10]
MRRERQPDRVAGERNPVEFRVQRPRRPRVLLRDDEVEVARGNVEQGELRLALGDLDTQVRVLLREEGERLRHDGVRRGLEHGDAHGAAHGRERPRDIRFGLFEPLEHGLRVPDEQFGLRRELHPAADLHQERDAGLLLELRELLRDRRRAVRERVGDRGERAPAAELDE